MAYGWSVFADSLTISRESRNQRFDFSAGCVDTEIIPFGTVLVIDGHEYIAEDTGSAVKGQIIDIYFSTHEAAREYGVQYKTIYIKGE